MTNSVTLSLYQSRKKSVAVAYTLFVLLGFLGAHRFYLGRYFSGVIIAVSVTCGFIFGVEGRIPGPGVGLIVGLIYGLIDLFLIPSMVRRHNLETAAGMGISDLSHV